VIISSTAAPERRLINPALAAILSIAVLLAPATVLFAPSMLAQSGQTGSLSDAINDIAARIEEQVIVWRRDIHQHPELGNREFRTAALVAEHLRSLGMEVQVEVAHTGVVGLLRGGRPGPVVALRADMDALPVTEELDLPFASQETAIYNGREVGVMHACGHDNHVAILMGAAQVLSELRDRLPGTVKFIFQPAEEGAPPGEEGGANLMIREGVLQNPVPDAIFGLHVFPGDVGTVGYRPEGALASADGLRIVVRGRQTHGAQPWGGIDPIVVASQIVLGLQTIVSRQVDMTATPSVVTVGSIHGGVRGNIIPDEVELVGTIRTFDASVQEQLHSRIRETASNIAAASGATAETSIHIGVPVTYNDPALTESMVPTLRHVAGADNVYIAAPLTGSEDFSFFAERVPGLYFALGVTPRGADLDTVPVNHSPRFFADEQVLLLGVRALANLAVDYMEDRGGEAANKPN
jgi:amidohydrolase